MSPRVAAAPALRAAGAPRFSPWRIRRTPGKRSLTLSAVPSRRAVVHQHDLVPGGEGDPLQVREERGHILPPVAGHDHDAEGWHMRSGPRRAKGGPAEAGAAGRGKSSGRKGENAMSAPRRKSRSRKGFRLTLPKRRT